MKPGKSGVTDKAFKAGLDKYHSISNQFTSALAHGSTVLGNPLCQDEARQLFQKTMVLFVPFIK
jgi:hypothetical protein